MSSISVNTITDASGGATTSINGFTPSVSNMAGRNRIINGDMRIDQRNNGASVNPGAGTYTLDRWLAGGVHDGLLAVQRVADAPAGFLNSLKVTVSTADASIGSTQYARVGQSIEGFNVADFNGGTANAATVTLSFWVKSSLTGTFGGVILSGAEDRSYVFQYTINASNTWEKKAVTLALASSGTWNTDNTHGMRFYFNLAAGSTYIATANVWGTSYAQKAAGDVDVLTTSGATWQITGVQLEAGSVATPFEHRQYGQELALCQRYCYVDTNESSAYRWFAQGYNTSSTQASVGVRLPVTMRTAPSGTPSSQTAFIFDTPSGAAATTAISVNGFTSAQYARLSMTCSGGVTTAQPIALGSNGSSNRITIVYSAEL